nr:hypothetical protein TIFTF001_041443 [Ficus carica]
METRSKSRRAGIDRFSSLPDIVAHKVVSFLEMEDISRLSVVSKRCRQLCISAPSLSFDVIPYRTDARKRAQLMNYLERLLILRKGMDTQDCHIRWCLESSFNFAEEEYRVLSWLHNALVCDFRRLDLDVNLKSGSDFVLPFSLFCSKSLESLTMTFTNRTGILKIPSSIGGTSGFSSLKCLKMTSVRINNSIGELVSSYCKSLEQLFLHDIRGIESITINSSSLKVLIVQFTYDLVHLHVSAKELAHLGLYWSFNSPNICELDLSALKLENLAYVVKHSTEPKPSFDKYLVHLLRDVAANIKGLILTDYSMLELFKLGCLPILLPNLELFYTFIVHARNDLVPTVASFLKGTPKLHGLYVGKCRKNPMGSGMKMRSVGRRESQGVSFLQNLKLVNIELITSQGWNELKLIKYFLKTAEDLERMTVLYSTPSLSKVVRKTVQHEKASSNAIVEFRRL